LHGGRLYDPGLSRVGASAVLSHAGALADVTTRATAAAALARDLGGDDLVLFAVDPELGVSLPAPGLTQVLQGAAEWQDLLARSGASGHGCGTLRSADGRELPAAAIATADGTAAVLLGCSDPAALEPLRPLLPLLGSLFRAERQVDAAAVRVRLSHDAVDRSKILTRALDGVRQRLEGALAEAQAARAEARARAEQAEALAEELERQSEELQQQATELEVLNEELSDRTAEAEGARAAAERANRAKSEFLATMSHELRTPINAVIGYAQLLSMGVSGEVSEAQRAQLQRIQSSSRHLLSLVNDVLDLAKVEAGEMTVEHRREDIESVVAEALSILEIEAEESGLRIRNRCGGSAAEYVGDRDRVRQILVNLLSNAIKFTEPGGRIELSVEGCTEAPSEARVAGPGPWTAITVEDTGIGLDPDEQARVFQAFVQADGGSTRRHGGPGLGLTISRQLARLMGGDLTLESEKGRGSRFTLWLPAESGRSGDIDATIRVNAQWA